jgi:hypothetical protein
MNDQPTPPRQSRLRRRADAASFAAAWDAALATRACGSSAPSLLWHRAIHGTRTPIIRNGEPVGFVERADNNALLKLLRRFDRQAGGAERRRSRKGKSQ